DVASHSPQMDPLRADLLEALGGVRGSAARIAMRSTVTGEAIQGPELDAAYWARNLRDPVLFSTATRRMLEQACDLFVDVSPHPTLTHSIEENLRDGKRSPSIVTASLRRGAGERRTMLEAVGALYTRGVEIDWKALSGGVGRPVRLPRYPWQRARYWID